MEDDLIFLENGRRPKFLEKMKTSILSKMEGDLNFKENGRDLNINIYGRQHQF